MTLHEAFEDWLADHFDPERTQKGSVRHSAGLPVYGREALQTIRTLVGCSVGRSALRAARKGEAPPRIQSAMRRCVELHDLQAIRRARRDAAFVDQAQHALLHRDRFGHAPDGGSLQTWLISLRSRLADRFGVDKRLGGEARELFTEHAVSGRRRAA